MRMPRVSFATRIGLIIVVSLAVAWIGSIVLFYVSRSGESLDPRPLPNQVTALVNLIERSPAAQRALILPAVRSPLFVPRIEPGHHIGATPWQIVPRLTARSLRNRLQALGGRPVSVELGGEYAEGKKGPRARILDPVDLIIRVGLRTGETLVVETRRLPVTTNALGMPIGFIAGLLGTGIGLLALFLLHRQTQPLTRLAAAVDRMDLSGASTPLPESRSGAPEIRALIDAFNRLHGRLSQLLRARMAMLGGISHDVRTFATRLRLRVDQIPEGVERERAIADIADMIRLLDDALLASRAGAGELAEELVEFDQVVRAEVDDRRAEGQPVDLHANAKTAEAIVLGDRLALRRVVSNLVDNALKYGRAAHVNIETDDQSVLLTVDDEGAGIPPDQREAMLEPFVRMETSRNRKTGGAGLGLAVVRNLVEAHAGAVAIADAPKGGGRFTVRLPLFRS